MILTLHFMCLTNRPRIGGSQISLYEYQPKRIASMAKICGTSVLPRLSSSVISFRSGHSSRKRKATVWPFMVSLLSNAFDVFTRKSDLQFYLLAILLFRNPLYKLPSGSSLLLVSLSDNADLTVDELVLNNLAH